MSTRLRSIPFYRSKDPALNQVIDAYKQIIETQMGIRGNPLDKVLTLKDLQDVKIIDVSKSNVISKSSSILEVPKLITTEPKSFAVIGAMNGNILGWINPTQNFSHIEIWAADTDDISLATHVASTESEFYYHSLGTNVTRYYWIRAISTTATPGAWNDSAGTSGITGFVDEPDIKDLAVSSAKIALLAVDTAHLADASILEAKIGNLQVSTAKIANLSITEGKIDDLAVTSAKIALLAVTDAQIANATITSAKIDSLDADKINVGILTGHTLQTSDNGFQRVVVDGTANEVQIYSGANQLQGSFGYSEVPGSGGDSSLMAAGSYSVPFTGGYAIFARSNNTLPSVLIEALGAGKALDLASQHTTTTANAVDIITKSNSVSQNGLNVEMQHASGYGAALRAKFAYGKGLTIVPADGVTSRGVHLQLHGVGGSNVPAHEFLGGGASGTPITQGAITANGDGRLFVTQSLLGEVSNPYPWNEILTESVSVNGTDGYVKLSSGLIIQWMVRSAAAISTTMYTWPIAFTTSNYAALGNNISTERWNYASQIYSRTLTQVGWRHGGGGGTSVMLLGVGF